MVTRHSTNHHTAFYRVFHRGRSTAATIVNSVGTLLALVLAAHIAFVLLGANPSNALVVSDARWADRLSLWFHGLFATGSATTDLLVNYGLAAVFWLFVTGAVARALRQVG